MERDLKVRYKFKITLNWFSIFNVVLKSILFFTKAKLMFKWSKFCKTTKKVL